MGVEEEVGGREGEEGEEEDEGEEAAATSEEEAVGAEDRTPGSTPIAAGAAGSAPAAAVAGGAPPPAASSGTEGIPSRGRCSSSKARTYWFLRLISLFRLTLAGVRAFGGCSRSGLSFTLVSILNQPAFPEASS